MPKARRSRTNTHDQSARLSLDKRQFALPGRVDHIEVGAEADASAMDLIDAMESSETPVLKKKEKQQLKHEAFLQRLESLHTPYSKSHTRRLKRKARDQIASGLEDVALALPEVEKDPGKDEKEGEISDTMHSESTGMPRRPRKDKTGMIGEGKSVTLSVKQRKQILKTEKIRQPLLLATPEFASNPFEVLRIHAKNTLIKQAKS